MSAISINGSSVALATITIPFYGSWTADVVMPTDAPIASPARMLVGDVTMVGTVVRQAAFAGDTSARIVGGANGWSKSLPSKGYSHLVGVKMSSVLADLASESGESITVDVDRTLGNHYGRDAGKASLVLDALTVGAWWIDPSGVTQTKARDSSAIVTPFNAISRSGSRSEIEIATETILPWQPGRTFSCVTIPDAQTISSVTIEATNEGKLRLHVLTDTKKSDLLRDALRALVRSELASIMYSGVWEYTISSATSTTVDASPVDSRMPTLASVPMMPGLIGEIVTPTPGKKCRIVFVNNDASRPECIGIVGEPILIKIGTGLRPAIAAGDLAGIFPCIPTQVKVLI